VWCDVARSGGRTLAGSLAFAATASVGTVALPGVASAATGSAGRATLVRAPSDKRVDQHGGRHGDVCVDQPESEVERNAAAVTRGVRPSWGGHFRDGVDFKHAPLADVLRYGPGARVEIVLPDLSTVPHTPGQRWARGYRRYDVKNVGGGVVQVTDPERGRAVVARGKPGSRAVRRWWSGLSTLVRYAVVSRPERDLSSVERAFPDHATRLSASVIRQHYPAYPAYPAAGGHPAGAWPVLLPSDVRLSPAATVLIRDGLLRDQPVEVAKLVGADVDRERALGVRFRDTRVDDLVERAGRRQGRAVLGIARVRTGAGSEYHTVAAVEGQLVLYDSEGRYQDHVEWQLGGHVVGFLPTSVAVARVEPRAPRTLAELPGEGEWSWVASAGDAFGLAEDLGPGETVDIVRTQPYPAGTRTWYPEFVRLRRNATESSRPYVATEFRFILDMQWRIREGFRRYLLRKGAEPSADTFSRRAGPQTRQLGNENRIEDWLSGLGPVQYANPYLSHAPVRPRTAGN
jgi:hypothetical protein